MRYVLSLVLVSVHDEAHGRGRTLLLIVDEGMKDGWTMSWRNTVRLKPHH